MGAGEAGLKGGRYVLVRKLEGGAQGTTFEAVDGREGRVVAIKRFDVRGATRWKDVELAEREARVLAALSHPRLPAYVDHFEEGGSLYLVMEKIEGESLKALRERGAPFREADAWRLLCDASEALAYLHGLSPPLVHRDLKPSNVIRGPDGRHAFVDFGSVRQRLESGGSTVAGTFGFMAPEQFQGRALPGSDVYGIGATTIAMLTGVDPEELPHKGLRIDVAAALGGKVSDELVETLAAMTDPDPDTRPARVPSPAGEAAAPRANAPRGEPAAPPAGKDPIATLDARVGRLSALARAIWRLAPVFWVLCGLLWWLAPHAIARDFTVGLVLFTVVARLSRREAERRERGARQRAGERARLRVRAPAVRVDTVAADLLDEDEPVEAARRRR